MTGADVLLLCGSYHAKSSNRAVLNVVKERLLDRPQLRVLESEGLEVLPSLNPALFEQLPPEVEVFRGQVDGARGFVVAGPEYAGGLAGGLKNALDWCVGADAGFYEKVVVVLSSGTSGGAHALRQMAQTLLWQGAFVVGYLGVAGPRSKFDAAGNLVDDATRVALDTLGETLITALELPGSQLAQMTLGVAEGLGIRDFPHKEKFEQSCRGCR